MGLESGIRDQRSGIWKKPISDPGSRGQKGTRSRIPDPGFGIPDPKPQQFKLNELRNNIGN
jgi:hypothetical protein